MRWYFSCRRGLCNTGKYWHWKEAFASQQHPCLCVCVSVKLCINITCRITEKHVMPVTANLLSVQCCLTSLVGSISDHQRLFSWASHHYALKGREHCFFSLFQVMSSTLPTTSQCISSLQRLDTPTPARVNHCTWGVDCTWMSIKTGCRPSIWPRATSSALVSFLMKKNSSGSIFINTCRYFLNALLDPLM